VVFLKYYREAGKEGLIRELIDAEEEIAMAEQVIQGRTETELENLRRMRENIMILDYNTWAEDTKAKVPPKEGGAACAKGVLRAGGSSFWKPPGNSRLWGCLWSRLPPEPALTRTP
jgi:hypothetical protein